MRIVTWIAVGAIAGLLAPTQARRLARDVATRFGGATDGPPAMISRTSPADPPRKPANPVA